jgi:hypothetical protein
MKAVVDAGAWTMPGGKPAKAARAKRPAAKKPAAVKKKG